MGNRAVILEKGKEEGIYLHWNGGRDSIEPMLFYCKNFLKIRNSDYYKPSAIEKLAFLSTCTGFQPYFYKKCTLGDVGDNGTYIINSNFEIVDRLYFDGKEQQIYNFVDFLIYLDENMPKSMQKGKEYIFKYLASKEPSTLDYKKLMQSLNVGDVVFYRDAFLEIIGKNNEEKEKWVNGIEISKSAFFNYTSNYENESPFKIKILDQKAIEHLKNNPNSYFGKLCNNIDDNNFKILDKELYQKIKSDFEKREKEQYMTN